MDYNLSGRGERAAQVVKNGVAENFGDHEDPSGLKDWVEVSSNVQVLYRQSMPVDVLDTG